MTSAGVGEPLRRRPEDLEALTTGAAVLRVRGHHDGEVAAMQAQVVEGPAPLLADRLAAGMIPHGPRRRPDPPRRRHGHPPVVGRRKVPKQGAPILLHPSIGPPFLFQSPGTGSAL